MGLLDNFTFGMNFDPLGYLSDYFNTKKTNEANAENVRATNEMNYRIAQEANDLNYRMFKENQAYQTDLANTAVQRRMADLKAAGMNPLLAAGGEGASTPSMSAPTAVTSQMQAHHNDKMEKAQMLGVAMELRRKKAEDDSLRAQTQLYEESKKKTEEERQKAQWEAQQAKLNYLRAQKASEYDERNLELDTEAKALANVAQSYDNIIKKIDTDNTVYRGYDPKSQIGKTASDITDTFFHLLGGVVDGVPKIVDSFRDNYNSYRNDLQARKEADRQAKIEAKIEAKIQKEIDSRIKKKGKLTSEQEAYIRKNLYDNLSKKYKK